MRIMAAMMAAYLLGGFPTGVLVGRYLFGQDIRRLGSGNPGAINIWRVFGIRWGLLVVAVDMGKGWAAAGVLPAVVKLEGGGSLAMFLGFMAVCGHIWSPFTGLRGGKGVGTAFGSVLAVYPITGLICIVIWFFVLSVTRVASVASMLACACFVPVMFIRNDPEWLEILTVSSLPAIMVFTHRDNIQRLIQGEELKMWGRR